MKISREEAKIFKLAIYEDVDNPANRYYTTVSDIHNKQECIDCAIYDLSLDDIMHKCYCSTFTFLLWHPNPSEVENSNPIDWILSDEPLPGALCDIFDRVGYNYALDDYDGFDLELNY